MTVLCNRCDPNFVIPDGDRLNVKVIIYLPTVRRSPHDDNRFYFVPTS